MKTIDALYYYLTLVSEVGIELGSAVAEEMLNRIVTNSALALTVLKLHMETKLAGQPDPGEIKSIEVDENKADDI